jgi:hypothetical protein
MTRLVPALPIAFLSACAHVKPVNRLDFTPRVERP